jgi:Zn-dependent peptidase ImmA (M78 family)
MSRVAINPNLIRWAIKRSAQHELRLVERFPKLPQWESGDVRPTVKQLEQFAKATLTPFGAFFLPSPPQEKLPVPDFRTLRGQRPAQPSAALIETIYQMQRRQDWMRDYLLEDGVEPLPFIESVTLKSNPAAVAENIRRTLGMEAKWADLHSTWTQALLALRRAVEDAGILVVINGVFGNNTHQPLNPEEFRGFVLCDPYAPLIFINGADFKSAQMFTLAHELAHLWIGEGGVFDLPGLQPAEDEVEVFCNRVAAELLIPARELHKCWRAGMAPSDAVNALAKQFKVSPIVAARRALDEALISRKAFFDFWEDHKAKEGFHQKKKPGGGDFYRNQEVRIGHRFGDAVVRAARAGKLLYQDAYRLTGLYGRTFDQFAQELGFGPA